MNAVPIVHVIEAATGGARRHLLDVMTRADRRRFALSVIASARRDPSFEADAQRLGASGIPVRLVDMQRAIRPISDLRAMLRLYRLLRRLAPAIVHTHCSKAGVLGRIAARWAGVPSVVHTPHVFPFEMEVGDGTRAFYVRVERLVAPLAKRIVCISPYQRRLALEAGLGDEAKLALIENGIDADAWQPAPGEGDRLRAALGLGNAGPIVGVAGRFAPQKGHRYLLHALSRVTGSWPDVRLVLAGDGELQPDIERLAAELALSSRVVMAGRRPDMRAFYALCDVVAFPSLWEGLPYSLLEAMASGRPVVATRTGGMIDAIEDGKTGRLVPPRDPNAFAEALLRLLHSPDLRAMMGAEAMRSVRQRYRLEAMITGIERLYEECLPAKAGAIEGDHRP